MSAVPTPGVTCPGPGGPVTFSPPTYVIRHVRGERTPGPARARAPGTPGDHPPGGPGGDGRPIGRPAVRQSCPLRPGCQPFAGTQVSRVLRCRESDPGYDHIMSTDELSFDREVYPSCHLFVFTTFPSRSMASAPVLTRAWRHPSGMPAT